jgi:pilus assembly protein CpaC
MRVALRYPRHPNAASLTRSLRAVIVAILALTLLCLTVPAAVAADTMVTAPSRTLAVNVAGGRLLRMPTHAATVFVADSTIADVQPASATSTFVFGKRPGQTTLFFLSATGVIIASYTVNVREPEGELRAQSRALTGDAPARLDYTQHGALLQGRVPNAAVAEQLQQTASRTVGPGVPLANQLQVTGSVQVNLRVRVAEVSRAVSRQLGFNWSTIFSVGSFAIGLETGRLAGSASTLVANGLDGVFGSVASRHANGSAVLDAMATEGLVSILAEPNLTAESGGTATFLAGGEIPIPVPQALGVTSIEYKQYGVSVAFTPTVLTSGRIAVKVRPEVSEIDAANSLVLNGATVPALTTRRAETSVELSSGQSFAIAGLIQSNTANNVQKLPWLGDVPVLGQLFRSNQFQRQQTELVIVVTPYVVSPTNPEDAPEDANGYVRAPSDLDTLLFGRVAARGHGDLDPAQVPRLRGQAGFLFE